MTDEAKKITRKRPNPEAFARAIKDGATIKDALLAAGKSPAQACKGMKAVNRELRGAVRDLIGKDFEELVKIGQDVKPEEIRHAVIGGIVKGVTERSDKGAQMLKLAGSMKELNMFTADSVSGVIVLNAPQLPELPGIPMLEAKEIKALPSST